MPGALERTDFISMNIENLFPGAGGGEPARVAVFMSGAGTNAAALIEYERTHPGVCFRVVLLVTDAPETSRVHMLAERYGLPVAALDIRRYYAERGEPAIALITPRRRELRAAWTEELRGLIHPYRIDFGVLAGFVPLCNITADYPCLNVHPGDLTVEENGRRILAGLHFRPVETAILAGRPALRSSVILARPFQGGGEADMDTGPVLGVSPELPVDLEGVTLEELRRIHARRGRAPFRDRLREIASANLERLKTAGDHVVLPRAVADFAAGRFGIGPDGVLRYRRNGFWMEVKTVEYSLRGEVPLLP